MSIARRAQVEKEIQELDDEIAEWEASRSKPQEPVEPEGVEEKSPPVRNAEEETYKKRYADLRSHSQKEKNEWTKKIEALTNEVNQLKSSTSIPTNEAQIKEWAEKNPQAAAIIRAIAKEQAGNDPQLKQLRSEMEEIERLKQTVSEDRTRARILKVHPDFDDIKSDDAFHDWAEGQPKILQSAIYDSNDPDDIISVISLYKNAKGIKPLTDKDAAKAVRSNGAPKPAPDKTKGRFTESKVQAMSAAEFEKYEAEIMEEARTNPNFYDLAGGAR